MVSPLQLYRKMRDDTEFTVTGEHLRLLRHARVSWDSSEFGAPAINSKYPYDDSDAVRAIAEILDAPDEVWEDGRRGGLVREEAHGPFIRLHVETALALQIVLATGEFRPGLYRRSERWSTDWTLVDDSWQPGAL
jgi:hypothetical protein